MSASGTPPPLPGVPLVLADEGLLAGVAFDDRGLVPAVVQDAAGGEVLTVAYMNEASLRRTIETGRTWFWSRSRQEFWCKGETSGDRQYVREVRLDCDADALVVLVDQHGDGACHTKTWSCFYRTLAEGPGVPRPADAAAGAVGPG
ncbi:MAG: phosphoribosyl-AMP cyclohydrolase, partial [Acidimicrobiales bacterium]